MAKEKKGFILSLLKYKSMPEVKNTLTSIAVQTLEFYAIVNL